MDEAAAPFPAAWPRHGAAVLPSLGAYTADLVTAWVMPIPSTCFSFQPCGSVLLVAVSILPTFIFRFFFLFF